MSEDEIARRAQEAFAENSVQGFLIALAAQPGSITVIDPVDVPVEGRREADVITFDLPTAARSRSTSVREGTSRLTGTANLWPGWPRTDSPARL
jgi:hypothetical protein